MTMLKPTTAEIDRKLREEFRRRAKDYGITAETLDPVLAVLFRTFAQQVENIYSDTGRMRQALLEELMAGMQIRRSMARPAQTVVRFSSRSSRSKLLQAGTELIGHARSGERLTFATDASIEVSAATVAIALGYQDQTLELLPNVEVGEALQAYRPSLDPVRVNLGPQPALFLAIEHLPESGLRRHSVYFDLAPNGYPVRAALESETWWIFGPEGDLNGDGLLRPERGNSGMSQLRWQFGEEGAEPSPTTFPELQDGFYGGRIFVLPDGTGRSLECTVPRLLEQPLTRICGRDLRSWLSEPRVWIKIPMPPQMPPLRSTIHGIVLHAATASNIFCSNQTVDFKKDGTSLPIGIKTSGSRELLVAPLSVTGRGNRMYAQGLQPRSDATQGWFEFKNDRVNLHPGMELDGREEESATLRLWLTNGALGNLMAPGDIAGFASSATFDDIRVTQMTASSGGSDGEEYALAERRFAETMLTRGSVVTRADLETAALAYDRRILSAVVESRIDRRPEGLRKVARLWLSLDPDGFTDRDLELPVMQQGMTRLLEDRLIEGTLLDIRFEWGQAVPA